MCAGTCGGQKRALDFPELELQVVVSSLAWVLGALPESSAREARARNSCTVPLAPSLTFKSSLVSKNDNTIKLN